MSLLPLGTITLLTLSRHEPEPRVSRPREALEDGAVLLAGADGADVVVAPNAVESLETLQGLAGIDALDDLEELAPAPF